VDVKVVSAMLRHSTTGITQDLYSSVLPEVAASAADAIAALEQFVARTGNTAARRRTQQLLHDLRARLP